MLLIVVLVLVLVLVVVVVLVLVVVVVVEVCDAPEASWQELPQPGKCRGGRWANRCRQCPPRFSNVVREVSFENKLCLNFLF